ncbi:TonB-dependent receptor [Algibacter amylolyticus]|uniref:TonB-dependent receptor n=1 Tax=Algibacter amylolyticus TaxID=1608400 RepID=A0A5M7AX69_9FLAO|nr:TonB-dependent receptor [Algibacter amylolyticus]KAA5821869.1 TonB-dependent receptor [Algibacter amylolyticus]MBB5269333.1 TonB-linked SusC/RagA family outer membrane protein [Algibacter amylolyticus]TSJ73153.1 TonB-dependent receptor [Algibacter amylolyticus]
MKKQNPYTKQPDFSFKYVLKTRLFVLLLFISQLTVLAQTNPQEIITVTGTITEAELGPVIGANILQEGTTNGVMTDFDGNFTINVPKNAKLVASYVGFATQTINVNGRTDINIVMVAETAALEEIVIVGYGKQRKESVVASIVQVTGEEILQSGGVSTVGQALTGRMPGVVTVSSSGRPGDESPKIYIRGQSSWNGSGQPLILVDGIERTMNDVNSNDIETISILKDASATAVFGVKGGNGVILITTKRGKTGKAQLSVSASSTMKSPSKLPQKYDSYDAISTVNEAIERVVSINEGAWGDYTPVNIVDRYRNPTSETDRYVYPNVDWVDVTQKDFAMDHKVNLSVRGGTETVKYFGGLGYQHVGDIFDGASFDNGRDYAPSFDYDRFNFRSNIDFDISKNTRLSVNLSGHYGIQNGNEADNQLLYSSIYNLAPSLFYPIYPDGTYGRTVVENYELANPAVLLSAKGATKNHRVQVNTDFILTQKLDFITEGLSAKASLSYDNNFRGEAGVYEGGPSGGDNVIYKVYLTDGSQQIVTPQGTNQFDYVVQPWTRNSLQIQDWQTTRRLFYQFALNYDKTFDKHTVGLLTLMNREEYGDGDVYKAPRYREDWVARLVYNYDNRYFLDVNGAYNGSEKFGPGYKFDFFPSAAVGWTISNESFMENVSWVNKLKLRGSFGIVGDDQAGNRYSYLSQWGSGGTSYMNNADLWSNPSPYTTYRELVIGNPDLQWETSEKANIGFELGLFNNMFTVDLDLFQEKRYDIIIPTESRSVPSFFGFDPADVNLGKTRVRGMELALNFKKRLTDNWNVSANFAYANAKDEILFKEDPELKLDYQKAAGYPIGQNTTAIQGDMLESWNDVYGSSPVENNQGSARPGSYDIIDYNGDGIINGDDNVPYGYPTRPQNTYNLNLGADYKNFSFMVQFYGVSNSTKEFQDRTFAASTPLFFEDKADYWSVDNPNGVEILPGYGGTSGAFDPYRNWYDASFVRLQNMEVAYTFGSDEGSQYRVFLNGNNLAFWSDLPDDREENVGNQSEFRGNYPIFKRVNLGVTINF